MKKKFNLIAPRENLNLEKKKLKWKISKKINYQNRSKIGAIDNNGTHGALMCDQFCHLFNFFY